MKRMKKWQIKNFYLTFKGGPVEAKTEEEASEQITQAILAGEFEFDLEETKSDEPTSEIRFERKIVG